MGNAVIQFSTKGKERRDTENHELPSYWKFLVYTHDISPEHKKDSNAYKFLILGMTLADWRKLKEKELDNFSEPN